MTHADARLLSWLRRVTETPAPPFGEAARAALVEEGLRKAGLRPERDATGNVLAELPGERASRVALVAHLDTIFPEGTDVTVQDAGDGCWRAPGIGDNSASVALLLHLAFDLAASDGSGVPHVLLAFTVGEEGEGDLRGARGLVAERGDRMDAFVAVDGHLGAVVDAAVGSLRYRAALRGPGGHSWGDYPSPSAVHALGDAVHALQRLPLPEAPRSSVNVGQVEGGTGINAIAEEAWLTLDVRSLHDEVLEGLGREAERRLDEVARRHRVELDLRRVGSRPAGRSDDGRLRDAAVAALAEAGVEAHVMASSTDASAAVAAGVPAICFGVYRGGNAHRLSEWLDPRSLVAGERALRALLRRL